jgi:hypothetical protein
MAGVNKKGRLFTKNRRFGDYCYNIKIIRRLSGWNCRA